MICFVLCWLQQAFNEFNARKPDEKNIFKGVIKNRLFMGIIVITLVLQVKNLVHHRKRILVFFPHVNKINVLFSVCQVIIVEFLGKFASTTKLNWKQWLICVAIGVIRSGYSFTSIQFVQCLLLRNIANVLVEPFVIWTSWPLALVGKFIPVPKTPLSSKLSVLKFWGKKKSSGEGNKLIVL